MVKLIAFSKYSHFTGKKGAGSSWRGWSALIALKIALLEIACNSESKYIRIFFQLDSKIFCQFENIGFTIETLPKSKGYDQHFFQNDPENF